MNPDGLILGRVTLRRMSEADLPLLHTWLNRHHISEWFGGAKPSLLEVVSHYLPRIRGEQDVPQFIGLLGGAPVAWLQSYVPLGSGGGWWEKITDPGLRGMDLCIADAQLLGRGLGTRLVSCMVDQLFEDPAVTAVQIDPSPHNARAIRCYEKAGFRRISKILTPDGEAVYMLRERQDAR